MTVLQAGDRKLCGVPLDGVLLGRAPVITISRGKDIKHAAGTAQNWVCSGEGLGPGKPRISCPVRAEGRAALTTAGAQNRPLLATNPQFLTGKWPKGSLGINYKGTVPERGHRHGDSLAPCAEKVTSAVQINSKESITRLTMFY